MGKLDRLAQSIGANITDNLSGTSEQSAPDGPKLPVRLQGITKAKNTAQIPIAKIIADVDQPRETMEAEGLEALAASIMTHGILQPLLVRWSEETSVYILIAGERRWRAAQKAKLQSVPCVIREGDLDASARLTLQIVENEMREAISPLELARGYQRLMDLQGWSAGQLSSELHIPKSSITRTLELLGLPTEIQTKVDQGVIAPSVAAEVGRLPDKTEQIKLAEQVVNENLTRAAVVEKVKEQKAKFAAPSQTPSSNQPITSPSKPKSPSNPTAPIEIILDRDYRIHIFGLPADANPETIVAILRRALDKMKVELASTV